MSSLANNDNIKRGYVIFGPNARGPVDELYLEPFNIEGDSLHVANAMVTKCFRAERLRIIAVIPSEIIYLVLKGLKISNVDEITEPVPASWFDLNAFSPILAVRAANRSSIISLTFRNYSPETIKVSVTMSGTYLDE